MNKELLRKIGIIMIVISIVSIIVRMPVGEPGKGFFDIQFWTYMIMSLLNIIVGILILKNHKNAPKIAIGIIIATFIATDIASRIVEEITILDTICAAIIPAILIYGIKKSQTIQKKVSNE
ncbi:MAG: hypothetical protein WCW17_02085 [Patescibacteria group bacterium]|jgi:hypothetical protein